MRCRGQDAAWGCRHLKARLGLVDPLSGWFTRVAGRSVLAIGRRPPFFSIGVSSLGCLSELTTRLLISARAGNLREHGGSIVSFTIPTSEATHCHFHSILGVTQLNPIQRGWGACEAVNNRRREVLGAILEAG